MTNAQFNAIKQALRLSNAKLAPLLGLSVSMVDQITAGKAGVGRPAALLMVAYGDARLPLDWPERSGEG